MPIRMTTLPTGEIETVETGKGTALIDTISGIDARGTGYDHSEVIRGFGSGDFLSGGFGRDRLFGGDGNDYLTGGRGRDVLTGGEGLDVFYYDYPRDGLDRIKDFVPGEDQIMLAGGDTGFLVGVDGLAFNEATNKLTYDYDGVGGLKPVLIAKFNTDIDIDRDVIVA
jgi:Ca2+-binding RTX toxin-like protein